MQHVYDSLATYLQTVFESVTGNVFIEFISKCNLAVLVLKKWLNAKASFCDTAIRS